MSSNMAEVERKSQSKLAFPRKLKTTKKSLIMVLCQGKYEDQSKGGPEQGEEQEEDKQPATRESNKLPVPAVARSPSGGKLEGLSTRI